MTMGDDPFTDRDETGRYWLVGLSPGAYLVRQIVPFGFAQTFPSTPGGAHEVVVHPHDVVGGVDFGNRLAVRSTDPAAAAAGLTEAELDVVWSAA